MSTRLNSSEIKYTKTNTVSPQLKQYFNLPSQSFIGKHETQQLPSEYFATSVERRQSNGSPNPLSNIEINESPIHRRNVQQIGAFSLAKTPHYSLYKPPAYITNGSLTPGGYRRKMVVSTNICPPGTLKKPTISYDFGNSYLIRTQPLYEKLQQ